MTSAGSGSSSAGGVATSGLIRERIQWIDEKEFRLAYEFGTRNEFIRACLDKSISAVTKGGVSVKVFRGASAKKPLSPDASSVNMQNEVELSQEHADLIHDEWGNNFVPEMMRYRTYFGLMVVRPVPRLDYPGEYVPYVLPWNKIRVGFVESSETPGRVYVVEYLDAEIGRYPMIDIQNRSDPVAEAAEASSPTKRGKRKLNSTDGGDGSSTSAAAATTTTPTKTTAVPILNMDIGLQVQGNPNNVGFPMIDGRKTHLIFVWDHPTTDGRIQSATALIRNKLQILSDAQVDESYVAVYCCSVVESVSVFVVITVVPSRLFSCY